MQSDGGAGGSGRTDGSKGGDGGGREGQEAPNGVRGKSAQETGDTRSEWLRKLDEECPYQVVLPRGPDDEAIMDFLNAYVGKFDMYVEDEYAVFVRYCFADPLDAAIFRSRFEHRASRFRLAG